MKEPIIGMGILALMLTSCATTENMDRQALVDAGELTGEASDGSRVRCESVRVTGSRLSERICLTQREWDQMEENAQQARRDRDEQNLITLPSAADAPPGDFGGGRGPTRSLRSLWM